jgi:high-affinity iron transporter
MLFWMMKTGSEHRRVIEKNMTQHVQNQHWLGILLLSMMTTAREGTEMVIFLNASMLSAGSHAHELAGALLGITGALILSYLLFKGTQIISLKVFFTVTTALLILFGAGLVMHGVGALQEAHLLAFFDQTAWNTGTYLSQEHGLGSILEGLFGYEETPTVLQCMSYGLYMIASLSLWQRFARR